MGMGGLKGDARQTGDAPPALTLAQKGVDWLTVRAVRKPQLVFPAQLWSAVKGDCVAAGFGPEQLRRLYLQHCAFEGWHRGGVVLERFFEQHCALDSLRLDRLALLMFPTYEVVEVLSPTFVVADRLAEGGGGGGGIPSNTTSSNNNSPTAEDLTQRRNSLVVFEQSKRRSSLAAVLGGAGAGAAPGNEWLPGSLLRGLTVRSSREPAETFLVCKGFTAEQRLGKSPVPINFGDKVVVRHFGTRGGQRQVVTYAGSANNVSLAAVVHEDTLYFKALSKARERASDALGEAREKADKDQYSISFLKFARWAFRFCSLSIMDLAVMAAHDLYSPSDGAAQFVSTLHGQCSSKAEQHFLVTLLTARFAMDGGDADRPEKDRLVSFFEHYPIFFTPLVVMQKLVRRHTLGTPLPIAPGSKGPVHSAPGGESQGEAAGQHLGGLAAHDGHGGSRTERLKREMAELVKATAQTATGLAKDKAAEVVRMLTDKWTKAANLDLELDDDDEEERAEAAGKATSRSSKRVGPRPVDDYAAGAESALAIKFPVAFKQAWKYSARELMRRVLKAHLAAVTSSELAPGPAPAPAQPILTSHGVVDLADMALRFSHASHGALRGNGLAMQVAAAAKTRKMKVRMRRRSSTLAILQDNATVEKLNQFLVAGGAEAAAAAAAAAAKADAITAAVGPAENFASLPGADPTRDASRILPHVITRHHSTGECRSCKLVTVLELSSFCRNCERIVVPLLAEAGGYQFAEMVLRKAGEALGFTPHRPMPDLWLEQYDREDKRPFFFNVATGDSAWTLPRHVPESQVRRFSAEELAGAKSTKTPEWKAVPACAPLADQ
jgi:hypothetical protein